MSQSLASKCLVAAFAVIATGHVLADEPGHHHHKLAKDLDAFHAVLQTSTLRRRVNQRDWNAAGRELRRWVYGGGKVLQGLVTRREAEAAWLLRST